MGEPKLRGFDPRAKENGSYDLSGLNQALKEGNILRASCIAGEVRAILRKDGVITGVETGSPSADRILGYLSKNYPIRPSGKHFHLEYIEDFSPSPLDEWVYKIGDRVEAYASEDGLITVDLIEQTNTHVPKEIYDEVARTGEPVLFEDRGYVYEISRNLFKIVEKKPNRKKGDYAYEQAKRGKGKDFNEAFAAALEAKPQDISPDIVSE
jgi:hypothetical protein